MEANGWPLLFRFILRIPILKDFTICRDRNPLSFTALMENPFPFMVNIVPEKKPNPYNKTPSISIRYTYISQREGRQGVRGRHKTRLCCEGSFLPIFMPSVWKWIPDSTETVASRPVPGAEIRRNSTRPVYTARSTGTPPRDPHRYPNRCLQNGGIPV